MCSRRRLGIHKRQRRIITTTCFRLGAEGPPRGAAIIRSSSRFRLLCNEFRGGCIAFELQLHKEGHQNWKTNLPVRLAKDPDFQNGRFRKGCATLPTAEQSYVHAMATNTHRDYHMHHRYVVCFISTGSKLSYARSTKTRA
ncbi:unnamed protein product [Prorocentrum cordatum]|uniref:Uncharacterized protein n=1 Tax=Prorocentrum cordatum TaxID=2364126 RepID=A0ABN9TNF7_9DINO|nr:unnamed protein product [Polarella glacialis]